MLELFCWSSRLDLMPADPDFDRKCRQLRAAAHTAPSNALAGFIRELSEKFPAACHEGPDGCEPVWEAPPEASVKGPGGDFVALRVRPDHYRRVLVYLLDAAARHRVDCYDDGSEIFFPAED